MSGYYDEDDCKSEDYLQSIDKTMKKMLKLQERNELENKIIRLLLTKLYALVGVSDG